MDKVHVPTLVAAVIAILIAVAVYHFLVKKG